MFPSFQILCQGDYIEYDIVDDEADEEKSLVTDFEEQVMTWEEESDTESDAEAETAKK